MPTRKENSVASGRFSPRSEGKQDGGAGARSAGKNGGNQLAEANGDGNGPGDLVVEFFAAQPGFDDHEQNAADEQRHGDRFEFLGQFQILFVEDEAADAGDDEREDDFQEIIAGGGFAPAKDELMEAFAEQRNDGEDRAGLDDDIEQIGLIAADEMLGDEQVAGGGNGEKFRDPFNDCENDDLNPVRHRMVRREKERADKPEVGGTGGCRRKLFFLFEDLTQNGLGFELALLDLELAEDGVPADVELVPLALDVAEGGVVHLAR